MKQNKVSAEASKNATKIKATKTCKLTSCLFGVLALFCVGTVQALQHIRCSYLKDFNITTKKPGRIIFSATAFSDNSLEWTNMDSDSGTLREVSDTDRPKTNHLKLDRRGSIESIRFGKTKLWRQGEDCMSELYIWLLSTTYTVADKSYGLGINNQPYQIWDLRGYRTMSDYKKQLLCEVSNIPFDITSSSKTIATDVCKLKPELAKEEEITDNSTFVSCQFSNESDKTHFGDMKFWWEYNSNPSLGTEQIMLTLSTSFGAVIAKKNIQFKTINKRNVLTLIAGNTHIYTETLKQYPWKIEHNTDDSGDPYSNAWKVSFTFVDNKDDKLITLNKVPLNCTSQSISEITDGKTP